jgi:hypothetical protein
MAERRLSQRSLSGLADAVTSFQGVALWGLETPFPTAMVFSKS